MCWELGGVAGLDAGPLSMRHLWFAACGAYDRDIANRAAWVRLLTPDGDGPADPHPLRRLERPPPAARSPAEKAAESQAGWAMVREFFHQKRRG